MSFIRSIELYLLILVYIKIENVAAANECTLNIRRDISHSHPLILNSNGDDFVLPNSKYGLKLSTGNSLRLVCTGKGNYFKNTKINNVVASCVTGTTFSVANTKVDFRTLVCETTPESIARNTNKKCLTKHEEIEIGFDVGSRFLRLITVCFNNNKKDSLYSHYTLTPWIYQEHIKVERPEFEEGGFYGGMVVTPSKLYSKGMERAAFSRLLDEPSAQKYISKNDDFFLARGHLTAKADFVYAPQQLATFYYVNVAPQWQTFNEGNWNDLEQSCRDYASNSGKELSVYTGTYGVLTLPNSKGIQRELYLYVNKQNSLTVPLVFWKVLYDPKTQAGIAFVGHNNVYDKNVNNKRICTDVCNNINWVSWSPNNVTGGYSYCCDVNDLRKVAVNVPSFTVTKLLV